MSKKCEGERGWRCDWISQKVIGCVGFYFVVTGVSWISFRQRSDMAHLSGVRTSLPHTTPPLPAAHMLFPQKESALMSNITLAVV